MKNNCKFLKKTKCKKNEGCSTDCDLHPWHREYLQGLIMGKNGYMKNNKQFVLHGPRRLSGHK